MATEVVMPQMGESIAEGTITKWLVKVGDKVERDQPLFEISTDKVDAEIPSPTAGVLLEIRHEEGETVPVDEVVAVIGEEGGGRRDEAAAPEPSKENVPAEGAEESRPREPKRAASRRTAEGRRRGRGREQRAEQPEGAASRPATCGG